MVDACRTCGGSAPALFIPPAEWGSPRSKTLGFYAFHAQEDAVKTNSGTVYTTNTYDGNGNRVKKV